MTTAPTFASAREAAETVRAGLGFLAAADATAMAAETQAQCLQTLEQVNSMSTAARASIMAAFTSGQGYAADADYSPRAWLIIILSFGVSQGCDLRCPVVDSVAGGTFAA